MHKFFEILDLIDRLDGLIRRKATGRPCNLARRLNICERKVYKMIDTLKSLGAPVEYCPHRESYYYTSEVEFRRELFVQKIDEEKVKGGESRKGYFFDLDFERLNFQNPDQQFSLQLLN